MSKNDKEIIAVIDIGSHSLKMKIAQINNKQEIKTIEDLRYPIPLGIDTFTHGVISYHSVREVCRVLEGYKQIIKDYGIENFRIVATNAVREAKNKNYVIDQINRISGLYLEVLDIPIVRFLTYKAIQNNLANYAQVRQEGSFLVNISAGSSDISIYKRNQLLSSQSIRIGPLRIRELLSDLQRKTLNFYIILEEYVASIINVLELERQLDEARHFIALGGEIAYISQVCNHGKLKKPGEINKIEKNDFLQLYQELVARSVSQFDLPITKQPGIDKKPYFIQNPKADLVKIYHIPQDMVDLFLPSMIIYKKFFEMSKANYIELPLISFRDGVLQDLLEKRFSISESTYYRKDIISSAWNLAYRYRCDIPHIRDVTSKAIQLFDQLKEMHQLGERDRLLLEIAAILHDIGKYISLESHSKNSYQAILSTSIIGVTVKELNTIANIVYYHHRLIPDESHSNLQEFNQEEKFSLVKLIAILKIANALDKSHLQKIKRFDLIFSDKSIICQAEANKEPYLEEWAFNISSKFFQDIFGIKLKFKLWGFYNE